MGLFGRTRVPSVRNVVDGVVFDTAKATFLAAHRTKRYGTDWLKVHGYFIEYLLKSSVGNWFIVLTPTDHSGKAPGRFDKAPGNSFIKPIAADEAFTWLNQFQEVSHMQEHFPEKLRQG